MKSAPVARLNLPAASDSSAGAPRSSTRSSVGGLLSVRGAPLTQRDGFRFEIAALARRNEELRREIEQAKRRAIVGGFISVFGREHAMELVCAGMDPGQNIGADGIDGGGGAHPPAVSGPFNSRGAAASRRSSSAASAAVAVSAPGTPDQPRNREHSTALWGHTAVRDTSDDTRREARLMMGAVRVAGEEALPQARMLLGQWEELVDLRLRSDGIEEALRRVNAGMADLKDLENSLLFGAAGSSESNPAGFTSNDTV
jgi:hypothetical protein